MKINKVWIVLTPTPESEFGDICFSCTAEQFILQSKGGLESERIHGMYTNEKEAKEIAKWLIHIRDE
jgi:hypothetical protein